MTPYSRTLTYRGHVKNGVVILDDAPALSDGTLVTVEALKPSEPPRGSAAAIGRRAGFWKDETAEVDRLLAELQETKRVEVQSKNRR
jgi:hypothetical protein